MPIVVYLDTADFSNFSVPTKHEIHQPIFDYLSEKVEEGAIYLPFSMFHVVELIRDFDDKHIENRLQRARTVMHLSQGKAFRYPPVESADPISFTGQWFPDLDIAAHFQLASIRREVSKLVNEKMLSRKLSRKQRRATAKSLTLKTLARHIPDPSVTDQLFIPPKLRGRNVFRELLLGKISTEEMAQGMKEAFSDLELLVHLISTTLQGQFGFSYKVSQMFDEFIRPIQQLRENFQTTMTIVGELRDSERRLRELGVVAPELIRESKKARKQLLQSVHLVESTDEPTQSTKLPAGHYERAFAYAKFNIKNARKMQESDLIDLMHSGHLPIVDLWRGDTWFCDTMIRQKVTGYEKIVSKLDDLPRRIDELLAQQRERGGITSIAP